MIDTTNQDDSRHPVRRLLQSLPQISPRTDFDVRLHKRLSEEGETRNAVAIRRRLPAFAVSIASVAAVGVVAYFLLQGSQDGSVQRPTIEQPKQIDTVIPSAGQSSSTVRQSSQETEVRQEGGMSAERSLSLPAPSSDDILRRGVLREVGGTGARPEQVSETSQTPFLRSIPGATLPLLRDSAARPDSVNDADSLRQHSPE